MAQISQAHAQQLLKALMSTLEILGDEDLPDNGELSGAAVTDMLRNIHQQVMKAQDDAKAKEKCACGHRRGLHNSISLGAYTEMGHGSCMSLKCSCAKYTWVPGKK